MDPPLNPNIKLLQQLKLEQDHLYMRYNAMRDEAQDIVHRYHQSLDRVRKFTILLKIVHQSPAAHLLVPYKARELVRLRNMEDEMVLNWQKTQETSEESQCSLYQRLVKFVHADPAVDRGVREKIETTRKGAWTCRYGAVAVVVTDTISASTNACPSACPVKSTKDAASLEPFTPQP